MVNRLSICFLLFPLTFSCSDKRKKDYHLVYLNTDDRQKTKKWDDLFYEKEEIKFDVIDSTLEILHISNFFVNKKNEFIFIDGASKQIKRTDSNNQIIGVIGHWGGQGPGEFQIPAASTIFENDFFVFDIGAYRFTRFFAPDYKEYITIPFKTAVNSFLLTPSQEMVTYSFSHEHILAKWDLKEAKSIKKAFKPSENLRLFSKRFNLGGVVDYFGEGFLMVYPEDFEIRYYDYDLEIKSIIETASYNRYRPAPPVFPKNLSPYNYGDKHSDWWNGFLHIARIHVIDRNLVGIQLMENGEGRQYTMYLNIYRLGGQVLGEGLEVPHQGMVRYSSGGKVYVVQPSGLNPEGEMTPPKIFRYTFREKSS